MISQCSRRTIVVSSGVAPAEDEKSVVDGASPMGIAPRNIDGTECPENPARFIKETNPSRSADYCEKHEHIQKPKASREIINRGN